MAEQSLLIVVQLIAHELDSCLLRFTNMQCGYLLCLLDMSA
jgi:hypothetical protein